MTARKRRGTRDGRGRGESGGSGGAGSDAPVATGGGRGLLITIWAAVALVVVSAMYRAGRGELVLGHWLAVAVVVLMGVAVTVAVTRDPEA